MSCKSFHNLFSGMDEVAPDAFTLATNSGSKIKAEISTIQTNMESGSIAKDSKPLPAGVQLSASAPNSAEKELARMAVMIANFCKIIDGDANVTLKIWGSKSYCDQVVALAKGSVNVEIISPPSAKAANQELPIEEEKPSVLEELVDSATATPSSKHEGKGAIESPSRLVWNTPAGRSRASI